MRSIRFNSKSSRSLAGKAQPRAAKATCLGDARSASWRLRAKLVSVSSSHPTLGTLLLRFLALRSRQSGCSRVLCALTLARSRCETGHVAFRIFRKFEIGHFAFRTFRRCETGHFAVSQGAKPDTPQFRTRTLRRQTLSESVWRRGQ